MRKAFQILNLFAEHDDLGVTEIAKLLGMPKGSVYRFLTTLKRLDLLLQNPVTERYEPGPGLLRMSSLYQAHLEWTQAIRPLLEKLSEQTQGETVYLAVLEGANVVYIDRIGGKHSLQLVARVGASAPAHCTGTGKAILFTLSDQEIGRIFGGRELPRLTERTVTNLADLLADMHLCRQRGYSVDVEETEFGSTGIGAPIRNQHGKAIGAIAVSAPTIRIHGPRIDEIGRQVAAEAGQASRLLGWHGGKQAGAESAATLRSVSPCSKGGGAA